MTTRQRTLEWLPFLFIGALAASPEAFGWGVGHDDSSYLGATISPEPFKTNAKLCVYGHYPDSIQDHAVGHGRDGYLRRLFTFEAIDALRAGDIPKAMFLASAATHYLTDRACIAHAGRAWYHKASPDDPWTKFLPRKHQTVRVPFGKKDVYYPHLKGTASDTCLLLPEPEYNVEKWRAFRGSTNAYFDEMPSVRKHVTSEMLRRPLDWCFTDFDQHARWYASFIALDMLDPSSLQGPELKLRDATGMKAVCVEELINGSAQCAAYFGYLCTAAKTEVKPSLNELLPEHDKFMALARGEPVVAISAQAPWTVERAAHVLAMELLRAERRLAKTESRPQPTRKVADYVLRVSPEKAAETLRGRNAIVLLTPDDEGFTRALKAPGIAQGACGVIAAAKSEHVTIILRGATRHDTLYLVDYLLDLSWSPLHGRWPAERVVDVLKGVWVGWKLILDLRNMKGEQAVAYARKLPYSHVPTRKEDAGKYAAGLREGVQGGASEEEWWRYFLLELPLPDGRRGSDMIETGTDYSALMPVVGK